MFVQLHIAEQRCAASLHALIGRPGSTEGLHISIWRMLPKLPCIRRKRTGLLQLYLISTPGAEQRATQRCATHYAVSSFSRLLGHSWRFLCAPSIPNAELS